MSNGESTNNQSSNSNTSNVIYLGPRRLDRNREEEEEESHTRQQRHRIDEAAQHDNSYSREQRMPTAMDSTHNSFHADIVNEASESAEYQSRVSMLSQDCPDLYRQICQIVADSQASRALLANYLIANQRQLPPGSGWMLRCYILYVTEISLSDLRLSNGDIRIIMEESCLINNPFHADIVNEASESAEYQRHTHMQIQNRSSLDHRMVQIIDAYRASQDHISSYFQTNQIELLGSEQVLRNYILYLAETSMREIRRDVGSFEDDLSRISSGGYRDNVAVQSAIRQLLEQQRRAHYSSYNSNQHNDYGEPFNQQQGGRRLNIMQAIDLDYCARQIQERRIASRSSSLNNGDDDVFGQSNEYHDNVADQSDIRQLLEQQHRAHYSSYNSNQHNDYGEPFNQQQGGRRLNIMQAIDLDNCARQIRERRVASRSPGLNNDDDVFGQSNGQNDGNRMGSNPRHGPPG